MVAQAGRVLAHERGVVVPPRERVEEDVAHALVEPSLRLERHPLVVGLEEVRVVHPDLAGAAVLREWLQHALRLIAVLVEPHPRQVVRMNLIQVHPPQVDLLGELGVVAQFEELLSGLVLEGEIPVERVRGAMVDVHVVHAALDELRAPRPEVVIQLRVIRDLQERRGHAVLEQRDLAAADVPGAAETLAARLQDVAVVIPAVHHGEPASHYCPRGLAGLVGESEARPEVVPIRSNRIPGESVLTGEVEGSRLIRANSVGPRCGQRQARVPACHAVSDLDERALELVAQPEVQRELAVDSPVVLEEPGQVGRSTPE